MQYIKYLCVQSKLTQSSHIVLKPVLVWVNTWKKKICITFPSDLCWTLNSTTGQRFHLIKIEGTGGLLNTVVENHENITSLFYNPNLQMQLCNNTPQYFIFKEEIYFGHCIPQYTFWTEVTYDQTFSKHREHRI